MSRPVIAVFGATGAQGGGLVRALLCCGERAFRVRAVTRRPGGDAAHALWDLGAELCAASLDDPASVERALQGVHGVFCAACRQVHGGTAVALERAGTLAAVAARAGVRHLVWSRPEGDPVSGAADRCFAAHGLPLTRLATAFLWDTLLPSSGLPCTGSEAASRLELPCGDVPLPGIAAADVGTCAAALFHQQPGAVGRRIAVAAEHLTGSQMAGAMRAALGRADGMPQPRPRWRAAAGPVPRDVTATRRLHPGLQSFAEWLEANTERLAQAQAH